MYMKFEMKLVGALGGGLLNRGARHEAFVSPRLGISWVTPRDIGSTCEST